MVWASIDTEMGPRMKVPSPRTYKTAKELKVGQIDRNSLDSLRVGRRMDMVRTRGQTALGMKASGE